MAIIIGAVLGFLSGLGIGGGSLLMLYLTLAAGLEQNAARSVNLLFYLPCAGIAAVMGWKNGAVNFQNIWPAIAAGCLTAAALTWLGAGTDSVVLNKCFGGLLVVTGLREVFYRPRKSP